MTTYSSLAQAVKVLKRQRQTPLPGVRKHRSRLKVVHTP